MESDSRIFREVCFLTKVHLQNMRIVECSDDFDEEYFLALFCLNSEEVLIYENRKGNRFKDFEKGLFALISLKNIR